MLIIQVKEAIKKSVGNAIESIRLREQHLLRQVDYTSEHISSLLHTEALIQAEVRCVVQRMPLSDSIITIHKSLFHWFDWLDSRLLVR